MANNSQIKALINEKITTNGTGAITGSELNNVLTQMVLLIGQGRAFAGIATPSGTPSTYDRNVFWLATAEGTYTNFGGLAIPEGLSIILYNEVEGVGSYSFNTLIEIDDEPTSGSDNLVSSGAIHAAIQTAIQAVEQGATEIYDVSGNHSGASYSTLAAALALVPQVLQKGGISVKYIDSTSGEYVQYRLLATSWSTNSSDWEKAGTALLYNGTGDNTDGAMTQHAVKVALETKVDKVQGKRLVDDEIANSFVYADDTGYFEIKTDQEGKVLEGITLDGKKKVFLPATFEDELEVQGNASYVMESNDYVAVTLDNHNKILLAFKGDGDVVFGCGVPSQIKQYVDENSGSTGTDIVSQNDVVYTEKALKNLKRPSRSANTVQYTPFVLLHASDIHGDGETLERMVEYYNHYKSYIDDALISGDMVSGVYDDDIVYYRNTDGAEKIMLAVGNHDTAKKDGSTTIWDYYVGQASYERFIKDFYSEWGNVSIVTNKCYYHKDYADYGIRMIVTDCMDVSTDAQLTWLEGVLESTPSGYSVLCICHYPYYPKVTDVANASPHIECSFDSRQNAPTVADAHIPVSFIDAVDEWMANHSGKFICWLSGHTHTDYVCIAKGTTQLVITIDTAAHTARNIGYSDTERVSGKKSMDLFNLVGIDTYQKLIKVMRVGADMDSWMRRKETMCIQYASNNVYTLEDDMPKLIYCS